MSTNQNLGHRSQLAIAIMTSKSHQLLGSIRNSGRVHFWYGQSQGWATPGLEVDCGHKAARNTWRTSLSTTSEGRPSRGRRDCLGWTGKGEVKSNLFLTSVASPKAFGCFVWIAADGVNLVVDHLQHVVGQKQRQLGVVRGLEPGVRQAVEHLVAAFKM